MVAVLLSGLLTEILIPVAALIGIAFSLLQYVLVSKVKVSPERNASASNNSKNGYADYLIEEEEGMNDHNVIAKCAEIQTKIFEVRIAKARAVKHKSRKTLARTYSSAVVPQSDRVEIIPNGEGNQSPPSMPPLADVDCLIRDASKNPVSENRTNTTFAIHAGDATPQSATEVDFGKDMVECNAQAIVSLTEDEKAETRRAKRRANMAKRSLEFKAAKRRAYRARKSNKNSAARDQNEEEAEIEAEEMQVAALRAYQANEVKVRHRKVKRVKTPSPKFSEDSKRHVFISSNEELAREIAKGGKLNITLSNTLRLKDAEKIKKKTHGGNKYKILNRNRLNWTIGKWISTTKRLSRKRAKLSLLRKYGGRRTRGRRNRLQGEVKELSKQLK